MKEVSVKMTAKEVMEKAHGWNFSQPGEWESFTNANPEIELFVNLMDPENAGWSDTVITEARTLARLAIAKATREERRRGRS